MKNYNKTRIEDEPRTELHDVLCLTGAEISVNALPAGASVPFVHSHRQNEEIYAILEGKGYAVLDGEQIDFSAGDFIRISPAVKRRFFASEDSAVKYMCIQVKENSLEGYTMTDAVV